MVIDICSRNAEVQISIRKMIERTFTNPVFSKVYVNAYNEGREYLIAWMHNGMSVTYGIDVNKLTLKP